MGKNTQSTNMSSSSYMETSNIPFSSPERPKGSDSYYGIAVPEKKVLNSDNTVRFSEVLKRAESMNYEAMTDIFPRDTEIFRVSNLGNIAATPPNFHPNPRVEIKQHGCQKFHMVALILIGIGVLVLLAILTGFYLKYGVAAPDQNLRNVDRKVKVALMQLKYLESFMDGFVKSVKLNMTYAFGNITDIRKL